MEKITLEYSYSEKEGGKCLNIRVADESWQGINASYLFSEVSESIIYTLTKYICFDLTNLDFACSSSLGSLLNLAEKARNVKKHVTFRFSKAVQSAVKQSNMESYFPLEASGV